MHRQNRHGVEVSQNSKKHIRATRAITFSLLKSEACESGHKEWLSLKENAGGR